mgnify:CR=1 FL=1
MRKMGPHCERLMRELRNCYPQPFSFMPTKSNYYAAQILARYGFVEKVPNHQRTIRLTEYGRTVPTYIVKYTNKSDSPFHGMYQGPSGLCVNSGTIQPHRSTIDKKDAYLYFSLVSASRAARHCNDSWSGKVIQLNVLSEG